MRRTILLLATMALTLLVASGVALAVTRIGTEGPNTLRGTNGADTLIGKGGNDVLFALGANNDNLVGG
jgi:Ca2+-binding RTX toxin-like protein